MISGFLCCVFSFSCYELDTELHRVFAGRMLSGGSRLASGKMSPVASRFAAEEGAVAIRLNLMGEVARPFPVFRSTNRGNRFDPADTPREMFADIIGMRILLDAAELANKIFVSWLVYIGVLGFFIGSSGFSLQKFKQIENEVSNSEDRHWSSRVWDSTIYLGVRGSRSLAGDSALGAPNMFSRTY